MARGIRNDTLDRIAAARLRKPMGIGPLLGEYAVAANMPLSMIAELVGTHEQTATRWVFGQSEIQPQWLPGVMKLLALLVWMRHTNADPLYGPLANRRAQVVEHLTTYRRAVKSASRVMNRVA